MSSLDFLKKVLRFFKNYFLKDPGFVFYYGLAYFRKDYTVKALFYTNTELVEEIKKGKSVIRIGDGEIGLLHGRDIHYQKCVPELIKFLREMVLSYSDESEYILSIPVFVNYKNKELAKTKGKLSCWLPLKVEFNRIFNHKAKYSDAHFFYYKNNFEKSLESYLKTKKLIINTTQQNINTRKDDIEKVFNVIDWITAKTPQPFDGYQETVEKIDLVLEKNKEFKKDIVLIFSSGPLGKALSFVYSKKGVQCIDLGKGFEHIYNDKNFEDEI